MSVVSTSIPNQRGCATTASNVALGEVTTPTNRDSRLMGACVAPASVEGLAISLGVANLAALVPAEGCNRFYRDTGEEYDRSALEVSPIQRAEPQHGLRLRGRRCDRSVGGGGWHPSEVPASSGVRAGPGRAPDTRIPLAEQRPRSYAKLTRMGRSLTRAGLALIVAVHVASAPAAAQSFEVLGTRAAGMGGAFVAVADDATAVYWNPAGLALGGSYFGLVLDNNLGKAEPEDIGRAGRQSASIIALTAMPVGLSYYRLAATTVRPTTDPRAVQLVQLTTHHAGVTLVQSVTERFAVAATLKWVRGNAAAGLVPDGDPDDLLDGAGDLPDESSSTFDADIGVMASLGKVRAGLTVRNVTEPDFSTAKRRVRVAESSDARRDFLCRCAGRDRCRRLRPGARRRLARRGPGRRRRGGGQDLQAGLGPERLSLQHPRRRAGRPRAGLQPRRQRHHIPVSDGRCAGHARFPRGRPRLGHRGPARVLTACSVRPFRPASPNPEPRAASRE